MRRQAGFSLVELMVVVAIVGILAAIAIPSFVSMQLKAKRAELPANVAGIKMAEMAYESAFDEHVELPLAPRADNDLDRSSVEWTAPTEWTAIGWRPDGALRGNYQVGLSAVDHPGLDFLITARADVDGDDALTEYTASDRHNPEITQSRQDYF